MRGWERYSKPWAVLAFVLAYLALFGVVVVIARDVLVAITATGIATVLVLAEGAYQAWRAALEARDEAERKPPAPSGRRGIVIKGGTLTSRGGSIRNQDIGIESSEAEVELEDPNIE